MDRQEALSILGINGCVSPEILSKQFRLMQRKTHPDLGGSAEEFQRVFEAHEFLSQNSRCSLTIVHLSLNSHQLVEL